MTRWGWGYVQGRRCELTPVLVEEAVQAAANAVAATRRTSLYDRAQVLSGIAARLNEVAGSLAGQLAKQSGFLTENDMRLEVLRASEVFQLASAHALQGWTEALDLDAVERARGAWGLVRREPIGAVLGITAFNGPLLIPAHKLAPAIAAGTSIVFKPAPGATDACMDLAGLAVEAGWPAQAVAVLDVGNETTMKLVEDFRLPVISFTGGSVGWKIKEAAPRKHVLLELGGVGAVLVAADANLELAARECAAGALVRSGQSCISVQRIYAASEIAGAFTERLVHFVKDLERATPIGPLANARACSHVQELVEDAQRKGARLLCGGGRASGELFEPTVLAGAHAGMAVMRDEAFGPVVAISAYDDIQAAITDINAVGGAIHHGIYTSNLDLAFAAADAIRAGGVIINGPCTWRADHMPYGGVGNSGFGREGIASAVREFTEPKVIVVRSSHGGSVRLPAASRYLS